MQQEIATFHEKKKKKTFSTMMKLSQISHVNELKLNERFESTAP